MAMHFEQAGSAISVVGESPVWHPGEGVLYHVDIRGRALHRHDPATGETKFFPAPEMIACLAPRVGWGVYAAMQTGLFSTQADGFKIHTPMPDIPPSHRFNDGCLDGAGRFLAGTMRMPEHGRGADGALYAFEADRQPRVLMDGFRTINGLAIAPDGLTLYVSDSAPEVQTIWRCAYDPVTGNVGPRKIFVDMRAHEGRPDGGTVDAEDHYWCAATEAGAVLRFDRDGRLVAQLNAGTPRVSKPCFGGVDLTDLYLTTLRFGLEATADTRAGALLVARSAGQGWVPPMIDLG